MSWPFVIIGACLELIGWSRAMNVFAELPWCPAGYPHGFDGKYLGCSTSMLGDGYQLPSDPEKCWMPAPITDPYYDFLWCQPVSVDGVQVTTPCTGDFTAKADAPCEYKTHWAEEECPDWMIGMGWCTRATFPECP